MPPITTSYSTSEEVAAILAEYGIDGEVDTPAETAALERLSNDILAGLGADEGRDLDRLTAYVSVADALPPWMLDSEPILADPSAHPTLWEDDFESNLRQLGDARRAENPGFTSAVDAFITALMTRGEEVEGAAGSDILDRVEEFLNNPLVAVDTAPDPSAPGPRDPLRIYDPREMAHLAMTLNNPGLALMIAYLHGLGEIRSELRTTILDDGLVDVAYNIEDAIDVIATTDPADGPQATADIEEARIAIQTAQTIQSTYQEILRTLQEMDQETISIASQMNESKERGIESIIRNI